MAVIDENKIIMSNDFFNFNRLFYYCDNEYIVCSNRYHLILLVLKEIGINCEINEEKAILNLSSVNIQFLTQNTLSEMDIKKVYKCVNSFDISINSQGINFIENVSLRTARRMSCWWP